MDLDFRHDSASHSAVERLAAIGAGEPVALACGAFIGASVAAPAARIAVVDQHSPVFSGNFSGGFS